MKKQVFNPYLPLCEYIPDGEPHVFNGRVYIYGSHDEARGTVYCPGNYVVWSAPVDDLKDWRREGEIYRREQDPSNADGAMQLWAPDVTKGPDGRYYLYYCFPFYPEIGVAVCDTPAGKYEFYGHVHYPDGAVLKEFLVFDPAVLTDEDGRVYLYYGFAPAEANPDYPIVPSPGAMVVELEHDMLTVKDGPKMCVPGAAKSQGTGFEGHAFYEAASIRRINGMYYFIYSSQRSHELCYAVSRYPDREFGYGGVIVSNGDLGLGGRTSPCCMTGNNHGSLVCCQDEWYIFYHRQTHATEASRQGCAEKVHVRPDGSIPQVEITSCGLNGGPLAGQGIYSAGIACHLTGKNDGGMILFGQDRKKAIPYIYEEDDGGTPLHYIANVTDGTTFGFKYFDLHGLKAVRITLRGNAAGILSIYAAEPGPGVERAGMARVNVRNASGWTAVTAEAEGKGVLPLYFTYTGEGSLEVAEIELI